MLSNCSIFQNLKFDQIEAIASNISSVSTWSVFNSADTVKEIQYAEGEVIFKQGYPELFKKLLHNLSSGDQDGSLYFIVEGTVCLMKNGTQSLLHQRA